MEANATGLVLKLIQLPPPTTEIEQSPAWHALLKRLLSVSIRVQSKGMVKSWMTEFEFYSTPLASTHPKEQGSRRPVYFQYDMGSLDTVSRTVEQFLSDWAQIVHLYTIVHDLSEYLVNGIYLLKIFEYIQLICFIFLQINIIWQICLVLNRTITAN